jgi:hypothetical protein
MVFFGVQDLASRGELHLRRLKKLHREVPLRDPGLVLQVFPSGDGDGVGVRLRAVVAVCKKLLQDSFAFCFFY